MNLREFEAALRPTLEEEVRGSVYIAGPMSNRPYLNFPAFDEAAAVLRERGYPVHSPAEMDAPGVRELVMQNHTGADMEIPGHSWEECLARDIKIVCEVDMVVALPEWWISRGAVFEIAVALKLGKPVLLYEPQRSTLCEMDLMPQIAVCTETQRFEP